MGIEINELASCETLPVQAIMDNNFYYGEYKIIGNLPITADEWEPIISYGRSISAWDRYTEYLQYGLIFKETTIDKFNKYLIDCNGKVNPYSNESIGWVINDVRYEKTDLRAPENIDIKREIFTFFGLDANKSYAENLKLEIDK